MANKQERIKVLIQKNISDILLFELQNPMMKWVTVQSVNVSNDFSYAKVYVTYFDKEKVSEVIKTLNHLKGVIRASLAKKMDIYRIPELSFYYDDSYDKGARIEEILNELNKKEKE